MKETRQTFSRFDINRKSFYDIDSNKLRSWKKKLSELSVIKNQYRSTVLEETLSYSSILSRENIAKS